MAREFGPWLIKWLRVLLGLERVEVGVETVELDIDAARGAVVQARAAQAQLRAYRGIGQARAFTVEPRFALPRGTMVLAAGLAGDGEFDLEAVVGGLGLAFDDVRAGVERDGEVARQAGADVLYLRDDALVGVDGH